MLRKTPVPYFKKWMNQLVKINMSSFGNLEYTNQMYKAWKENPSSVHESWQEYFTTNKDTKKSK